MARAFGCDRLVVWGSASAALAEAARAAGVEAVPLAPGPAAPRDGTDAALAAWTHPDVAAELARGAGSGAPRGVTVFFTGLSGSGKSTIANALRVRLLEDGRRTVTLLDGDLVRTAPLVRARLLARAPRRSTCAASPSSPPRSRATAGVAICAPIAPYAALRREARALVERVGTFLLVYVATPLDVCEARDPKGLYQRARAGTLPEFTGVSDPYEAPDDADLTLDTSHLSVAQAVDALMAALAARGLLTPTTGSPAAPAAARPGAGT